MLTIVFEDAAADTLGVLVAARPACDLTIGSMSLVEAAGRFGGVRRAVRPHLAAHLATLAGCRAPVWGGPIEPAAPPGASSAADGLLLAVNARVVPDRDNLAAIRRLVDAGRRAAIRCHGAIAAAVLQRGVDPVDRVAALADGPALAATLESLDLPTAEGELGMLVDPHDVVAAHERSLEASLVLRLDAGGFREVQRGLYVADGATVAEPVAVRSGPVVVAAHAEIGPFTCLDGPIWIGPSARVNPHSWIRAGSSIGRECRVGGEMEASVMEAWSNKPHHGFLGHSHLGSWVNLAAGTTTSNLKATYGPIRLHGVNPDGTRLTTHTGRQFLGALVADFVRSGVNAAIPCGARIGAAATVGSAVPEQVVTFTNQLVGGENGSRSSPAQAATVLERMMVRRGLAIHEADRALLEAIA